MLNVGEWDFVEHQTVVLLTLSASKWVFVEHQTALLLTLSAIAVLSVTVVLKVDILFTWFTMETFKL